MPPRHTIYILGGIVTLAIVSAVAMNAFLTLHVHKVQTERNDALRAAKVGRVIAQLQLVMHSPLTRQQRLIRLQGIYEREGLYLLQIRDPAGVTHFGRSSISIAPAIAAKLSLEKLQSARPAPDQVLLEALTIAHNGRIPAILARTMLYADGLKPSYLVFLLLQDPEPPLMGTFEQFAVLFQTIAILALLALGWYLLRRAVRPYESLVREIQHSSTGLRSVSEPYADEVSVLVGSFKDVIRQLRDKERELQALHQQATQRADLSERRVRDVFHCLPLAILSLDARGIFQECNPALEELLGRRRVAFTNQSYREIFQDQPEICAAIDAAWGAQQSLTRRLLKMSAPGSEEPERTVSLSLFPLGDAEGVVGVIEDVTGPMQLQERLRLQENLAAQGEMAAGIAHELKNALSTISGYAQMLLGNARPGAEQKRAAALVQEVEEMARVITDFLEYARPMPLEHRPVALDGVIAEQMDLFAERHPDIEFRRQLIPCLVSGEEHLLKKAMHNLLLNAVQAMEKSAVKRVEVRLEALSGQLVRVWIEDTGPGIDAKALGRIFTPFFTTRPGGTGMGLAVVHKIVALHGGAIRVQSEPGRGTGVELDLPVSLPAE
ncbi:MAG TPA: ATP-binding protein [Acidobacteriota bacterium]|nr:PAS domain-containing protein [Acidobacteriota bacterium]HQF86489.1 ATP-binding protein [Acidobacteriota bacterium]HQG90259.1 ATP-binding protein [Acidobacteriota bacterium]